MDFTEIEMRVLAQCLIRYERELQERRGTAFDSGDIEGAKAIDRTLAVLENMFLKFK